MFTKVDTDILFEGFSNPTVVGKTSDCLLASYIGTVEIVDRKNNNEYDTELYLAIQIPSGKILGLDDNNHVFSLSNKMFTIHWGFYPVNFPERQKTKRPCPKALKSAFEIQTI